MKRTAVLAIALATVTVCIPVRAGSKSIALPPDGVQLQPSPLPGYALAQAQCTACHSAEYMQFQPPNAARPYWDTMVKRMKLVFRAPLEDVDIPAIVDYLAKTYGAERRVP